MSIVIGSMILCVIGTFILMWICSMLMGEKFRRIRRKS